MRVSINLNQEAANMTAAILDCQLVSPEQADWFLFFYLSSSGGTNDPAIITEPDKTTIIAGPYTSESYAFAEAVQDRGVSADHIIFLPPGSLDRDSFKAVINATMSARKPKIIGFISEKGGTGKTTLAAALTYHYQHYNVDAVLLDICTLPNAHYHLAESVYQGSMDSLGEYKSQRIIVDVPTGFKVPSEKVFDFDVVVGVVDADVVQCIRPTGKAWPHIDIAVYNRCQNAVPPELVEQILNCPVISIEDDFQGCSAALAGHQPANTKSEKVEKAVGELARIIEGRSINNVENVCSRVG